MQEVSTAEAPLASAESPISQLIEGLALVLDTTSSEAARLTVNEFAELAAERGLTTPELCRQAMESQQQT